MVISPMASTPLTTEMEKTLLVIAGPTAVGKTSCGIEVAEHFGTEIISADSRQIYRETCIGTAVPSKQELEAVPHHFIQTISVRDPYNASMFEQQVLEKLNELFTEHSLVVMVGGAGLYIEAVCGGIDELPPADTAIRKQLHQRLKSEGLDSLTEQLKELDPVSHARMDLNNHMRVMKALEVSIQTGKPYSGFLSGSAKNRPFRILRLALDMERTALYERINSRVEHMMDKGLLEEVVGLKGLREYTALKTVGYRELFAYLNGAVSLADAVARIKSNTRKFARKQITWFRKGDRYEWIHAGSGVGSAVIARVEKELGNGETSVSAP